MCVQSVSLSEEIGVDFVEVLAEVRVLLFKFLTAVPLFKRLVHVVSADLEHGFGISASSLLQAPGCRVVKAKTTGARARVLLLEVVSHLEARESLSLRPDCAGSTVVAANALRSHKVFGRVLGGLRAWLGCVAADSHVQDDVLVVVHDLHALLDS